MKIYEIEFLEEAYREWLKLGETIRRQFKKKLEERVQQPHAPASRLSAMPDCYKIKLRSAGYRLVYRVIDERIIIQIVAVGRRDRNQVYKAAIRRID